MLLSVILAMLAVIFGLIFKLTAEHGFKYISIIILCLSYICYYLQPVFLLYENWGTVTKIATNPIVLQLENAKSLMPIRKRYLRYLMSRSDQNLKFVLNLLKDQKADFENKVALIVGGIDKVGLTPGLIALLASWDKITKMEYDWVLIFAYIVPFIYAFGIYCHITLRKFQSYISLVELALEEKTPNKPMQ